MNHQSLLDIPTAVLMAQPYIPRFIARARYGSWVPAVSLCMRLLGCPIIEPENRKASLRALREAARAQPHGILVFPEGHRTRDGEIQAFHTAGLEIMLRERPLPVYVLVTDGFWKGRRFVDFLFNIDRIDGRTEVMGPFHPPADREYAAFLQGLRDEMVERLRQLRGGAGVAA
jgi:1-acyl-sn-glycerol-3-phosphate acyltransferase